MRNRASCVRPFLYRYSQCRQLSAKSSGVVFFKAFLSALTTDDFHVLVITYRQERNNELIITQVRSEAHASDYEDCYLVLCDVM